MGFCNLVGKDAYAAQKKNVSGGTSQKGLSPGRFPVFQIAKLENWQVSSLVGFQFSRYGRFPDMGNWKISSLEGFQLPATSPRAGEHGGGEPEGATSGGRRLS